jgi:predicted nucleic acid-binding Zn ribbon protein
MQKNCAVCGKEFETNHSNHKTCSEVCSKKHKKNLTTIWAKNNTDRMKILRNKSEEKLGLKKPKIAKICTICGNEFYTGYSRQITCSKECREIYKNKYMLEQRKNWKKNNPEKVKAAMDKHLKKRKAEIHKLKIVKQTLDSLQLNKCPFKKRDIIIRLMMLQKILNSEEISQY